MIRITYITITYNAEAVLKRTLDSVLSQDYPKISHFIIDGASTDGTMAIIDDYVRRSNEADNGHRVQVTSEPDKGIYDAMNKGLRSIDGSYVCFLNAGDFLPAPDVASRINAQCSMVNPPPYYTVIRILLTAKGVSFITVVCHRPNILLGSRFVRECLSVIRPSMPAQTLPLLHPTTCGIVTLPMSIGASV